MKGKVLSWMAGAALAAGLSLGAAAQNPAQITPQPSPQLPPAAPLAGVKYDYRWEIYGGLAYSHFDAGPNLLQGANLGGFDARAVREFSRRWGVGANIRGYYGTTGVEPNCGDCTGSGPNGGPIRGPFVSEHMFLAGPEVRALSNEHAAMMLHAFVGGAYGDFQRAIGNVNPASLGLFSNQFAFGGAFGGSIDLNRSPRLVFRIAPDATLTNFGGAGLKEQFAISVGLVYRMGHRFAQR
ncbi:MAG TPA: hypothetical protein VKT75_19950 [Acidobacteriaceae bacterium]|nr:hypothetical protein [Acidobacteriaceae bacterium]